MTYSYEPFKEYQQKKEISDEKERRQAKANTQLSIDTYRYFGCSGPVTKKQISEYLKHKESPMNEEITNPGTEAVLAAPATQLTDAEVEALLASKPESAQVYVAEGDEAEGETIH